MASCLFYSFRSSRQVAQILRRRLTTDYYQNAREWIAARSELENFVCNTGTQLECVASSRIPLRLGEEGTLSVAVADLSSVLEAKQAELQIRSVLDDCATIEVFVDKADLVSGSKEQGIVIGLSRQPLSQVELVAEPTHDPFESVDALVCIKPNTASVLRLRVSLPERFGIDVRCGWNDLATTIERCEGSITVQSCKSFLAHRIRANKMDVHVLSGKIDIREMEANAKLFTYGGSLTIQKCSGDTLELDTAGKNQNSKESISIGSLYSKAAKVSSGSGSIEIGTLHGKALLKSESASIKIGGVEGEINVVSNEGSINVGVIDQSSSIWCKSENNVTLGFHPSTIGKKTAYLMALVKKPINVCDEIKVMTTEDSTPDMIDAQIEIPQSDVLSKHIEKAEVTAITVSSESLTIEKRESPSWRKSLFR